MSQEFEVIFRLILAGILGGFIGLERESLRKSAGFRTHILVCVGAALVMLVSIHVASGNPNADPARIAAQVVSGIGFLGAGTIMREGATVRGLTTAASLWVVACIGLAVGAGMYFASTIGTGLVFLALLYLGKLERRLTERRHYHVLYLTVDDEPGQMGRIGWALGELGVNIHNIDMRSLSDNKARLELYLTIPVELRTEKVITTLMQLEGVHQIELEE
ncbi:MgtC/SapB family protein [Calderihabitans maritimus]|uniref:MgtC/SapB transporter n=1 Tax=Calderihabitans maritimus TaxID=1246530 RepID=A0A1Z5HXQ0_9FIRM|nr:MgtC/SapB family protein [Calderihabitans maritimus]GAW94309.1 MgtC/SapB transporter [Calderihabitans maritimus]